jgi:hypothetical protein
VAKSKCGTSKNKGGRPKIEFTDAQWDQIDAMLGIDCTGEEVAAVMGVDYDTIAARVKWKHGVSFSDYIKQKRNVGNVSLRRKQWKAAESGNITMLIWLGKNRLGQTDKVDMSHEVGDKTSEKLDKLMGGLDRIFGGNK